MSAHIETRHLNYFLALTDAGSLPEAARILGIVPATLVRQIKSLERELAVQLFESLSPSVRLSSAGWVFHEHAQISIARMEAAIIAVRQAAQTERPTFIMGFLSGYELDFLPPIMAVLHDQWTATELVIQSSSSPKLLLALSSGKVDAALLRPGLTPSSLSSRLIASERLVVALPSNHCLTCASKLGVRDLVGHPFIAMSRTDSPALRLAIDNYLQMVGVELTHDHEAQNLPMAISLIVSLNGIALLPFHTRRLLPPSITWRDLEGQPPTVDLVLAYSDLNQSAQLRLLIENAHRLIPVG